MTHGTYLTVLVPY